MIEPIDDQPEPTPLPTRSILELEGLGAEVWDGVDPNQYVAELRDEWER